MAKATATRIARTFQVFDSYEKKNKKGESVIVPSEVMKRGELIPAQDREARPCRYCHKPMMVAAGQIAFYHKECRSIKRSFRKQGKIR